MKTNILIIFIFSVAVTACNQSAKISDPEKLKVVLLDYFEGISSHDLQKLNSVTTADFILYENGKIWNNDSLYHSISRYPNSVIVYKFDDLKINVDQSLGNIHYYNHGEFTINDTTHRSINWVESATFRKVDGEWKMDFLHSTLRK